MSWPIPHQVRGSYPLSGQFRRLLGMAGIANLEGMNTQEKLPTLLRQTAHRLDTGAHYEWGHMGRCNCGHLVQTLTEKSSREISQVVDQRLDEWTEYANDYCQTTGSPVDSLFEALAEVGFFHSDVVALEYLSDPRVLARLGSRGQKLRKNHAPDVSLDMRTLADLIEEGAKPVLAGRF